MTAAAAMRQLRSHAGPPLLTAAPGRWRWSDGCAVTVEQITRTETAPTLYHPSPTHVPSAERPMRELEVVP